MGLDINAVRFLIQAKKDGVQFGEVLMIGRQDLNVYPARMAKLLDQHGLPSAVFQKAGPETLYAEPCFQSLGASKVNSLDASGFEGAAVVHDLNCPLPENLKQRFDVVYDGGTLEHVFNFPIALQNCMEMLRVGGRLFIHTITNNWCGHGFYQFSPELFYRALSPENGFEVERMILHAVGPYGRWYEVSDPSKIRARVELLTFYPVHLLIQAKRISEKPVFAKMPQQSDYTPRWDEAATDPTKTPEKSDFPPPSRPTLAKFFPGIARLFHVAKMAVDLYRRESLGNRTNFRPVKKP